jgi:hypothetical protein
MRYIDGIFARTNMVAIFDLVGDGIGGVFCLFKTAQQT